MNGNPAATANSGPVSGGSANSGPVASSPSPAQTLKSNDSLQSQGNVNLTSGPGKTSQSSSVLAPATTVAAAPASAADFSYPGEDSGTKKTGSSSGDGTQVSVPPTQPVPPTQSGQTAMSQPGSDVVKPAAPVQSRLTPVKPAVPVKSGSAPVKPAPGSVSSPAPVSTSVSSTGTPKVTTPSDTSGSNIPAGSKTSGQDSSLEVLAKKLSGWKNENMTKQSVTANASNSVVSVPDPLSVPQKNVSNVQPQVKSGTKKKRSKSRRPKKKKKSRKSKAQEKKQGKVVAQAPVQVSAQAPTQAPAVSAAGSKGPAARSATKPQLIKSLPTTKPSVHLSQGAQPSVSVVQQPSISGQTSPASGQTGTTSGPTGTTPGQTSPAPVQTGITVSQTRPAAGKTVPVSAVSKPPVAGKFPYTIDQLLQIVVDKDASDLHITVGYPVMIRVDGDLIPLSQELITDQIALDLILPVLAENKRELLEVNREVDLSYAYKDIARFRINAYYERGHPAAALRLIPGRIRSIEELKLPGIYHQFAKLSQGFILVTGPTGHGKSTTLAAILQEINVTYPKHIITIEDPIEYLYPPGKALLDQREMHEDTHSWEIALRSALRQDPDVILVGEMRDFETIAAAITLAETGHLVFATLHTNNAAQTIDRVIDVFPEHQQAQVRTQLSNIIEVVISQRLIPVIGGGRRAVSEVMLVTPAIRNLIREGKTHQIDNVIRTSMDVGMKSLEHSLVDLVREGVITVDDAEGIAVHPAEVVRLLK